MVTTIPRQARPLRGLADLRTMTGARDTQAEPYKAFLRVSFLELERTRHKQEMQKVRRRVDAITARCREIEGEKARILAAMRDGAASSHASTADGALETGRKWRKFHLSY